MAKRSERKNIQRGEALERGINLDVPGAALIAQAGERIAWHKRSATVMAEELQAMTLE